MHVEIDQSGKIGDTSVDTVLAFANHETYAIRISASAKRECVEFLRIHYRAARQPYMRLFAAALFLLLRSHLHKLQSIVVDMEYTGQEATIKGMLLDYIYQAMPNLNGDAIVFGQIGKRSRAHIKAYQTYWGKTKPDRVVTVGELIDLLRK